MFLRFLLIDESQIFTVQFPFVSLRSLSLSRDNQARAEGGEELLEYWVYEVIVGSQFIVKEKKKGDRMVDFLLLC